MNQKIAKTGAVIVTASILVFAVCMLIPFNFGSYFRCMLLPIGYIMMVSGFCNECKQENKVAAYVGMTFAGIYAVFVLLVYFAQTTSVRFEELDGVALRILDYSQGGLFFSYDLLGYGMMALSTFFIGLTIEAETKADKWLKYLLIIHGVFFVGCFIMPMTGVFRSMASGENSMGGVLALEFWCAYFTPIGILSWLHFSKMEQIAI